MSKSVCCLLFIVSVVTVSAETLTLSNRFGTATIDTLGARVSSYRPASGGETLVTLPSGTGGIPLCWPWFQYNGPHGRSSPKHGIVRYREFSVVSLTNAAVFSEAKLRFSSDAATRALFPHEFEVTLEVRLDSCLHLALTGRNTGTNAFAVTEAFHPYLRRSAPSSSVERGSGRFRTWSPDATSHTKTQGLGPEDWKRFICVENGTFDAAEAYLLRPGETHTLVREITGGD